MMLTKKDIKEAIEKFPWVSLSKADFNEMCTLALERLAMDLRQEQLDELVNVLTRCLDDSGLGHEDFADRVIQLQAMRTLALKGLASEQRSIAETKEGE